MAKLEGNRVRMILFIIKEINIQGLSLNHSDSVVALSMELQGRLSAKFLIMVKGVDLPSERVNRASHINPST